MEDILNSGKSIEIMYYDQKYVTASTKSQVLTTAN